MMPVLPDKLTVEPFAQIRASEMPAILNDFANAATAQAPDSRTQRAVHEPLRGIIFDFDGTIAETERFGQRVAYNRAFNELGLDCFWDDELYRDLLTVAGGMERLRYYFSRYRPQLLDEIVTEDLLIELHRAKSRQFAKLAPAIPFRPGVRRIIYEAHSAGLRVAIATTASRAGVESLLGQDSAIPPMIDVIAAGEDVERKKPAPDVYLLALDHLGLSADACVAIEDSHIGLASALAAGLTTIVTVSHYTTGDDFAGAASVLSTLGDDDVMAVALAGAVPLSGVVDLTFLRDILGNVGSSRDATREPDMDGDRDAPP